MAAGVAPRRLVMVPLLACCCLVAAPVDVGQTLQKVSRCCGLPTVTRVLLGKGKEPEKAPAEPLSAYFSPPAAAPAPVPWEEALSPSPPAAPDGAAEAEDSKWGMMIRLGILALGLVVFFWMVDQMWFTSSGRAVSRLLGGTLRCRGTSVKLRLFSFSLILHDVELKEGIRKMVAANGLGGYLPCELEKMLIGELELTLQLVPLLRWLSQVVIQLTRAGRGKLVAPGKGTWRQQGLDGLEAMQAHPAPAAGAGGDPEAIDWVALSAACPVRVRLGRAELQHKAMMLDNGCLPCAAAAAIEDELGEWWGGQQHLDSTYAYFYKARYLEELTRLLTAHLIHGSGHVAHEPSGDERAKRVLMRSMLIVFDDLRVRYRCRVADAQSRPTRCTPVRLARARARRKLCAQKRACRGFATLFLSQVHRPGAARRAAARVRPARGADVRERRDRQQRSAPVRHGPLAHRAAHEPIPPLPRPDPRRRAAAAAGGRQAAQQRPRGGRGGEATDQRGGGLRTRCGRGKRAGDRGVGDCGVRRGAAARVEASRARVGRDHAPTRLRGGGRSLRARLRGQA